MDTNAVERAEYIAETIMGVILIATFICIFFFTYVSKVEGEVVKSQMSNIVNNLTNGLQILPDKDKGINLILKNLKAPDMSSADNDVEQSNNELKKKAAKIFGTIVVVGVIIIYYLWSKHRFDIKTMIIHSVIILVFVALTEFLFVTLVSKNYQIIDPNYVKYLIAKNLSEYSQEK